MKRLFALLLAVLLLVGGAAAEGKRYYAEGDTMEDFAGTLADGSEYTLYGLLSEKKLVLINFWASWCGPCRMEFPYMEAAYELYKDDIAILALSLENADTNEAILQFKADNGLSALPMGRDEGRALSRKFRFSGIPTSILVDSDGTILFIATGATDAFSDIFAYFLTENETQAQ